MNFLSVENISKRFGERVLFSDLSFGLNKGQKMALVAKNGEGKTTLLQLLEGIESPDTGKINWRKDIRIASLVQDQKLPVNHTVHEYLYQGHGDQVKAIEAYNQATQNTENTDQLQTAIERMEAVGAWDYEAKLKKLLGIFEMNQLDLSSKLESCSGGQQKRLALIKIIVDEPDVLLLDEPTNHLDIQMIEWLEEYLSQDSITLFLITHDRYFLNNCCQNILELDAGKGYTYQGNYEYFLEKKAEREQLEISTEEKQKNLYRREIEWMRRMPKARGSKSKARQDQFYELDATLSKRKKDEDLKLSIKSERMGSKIIEMHHLRKSYGELKILDDFSYVFKSGEKIGIAGKNGTGKSTFLKILLGSEGLDGGKVVRGETVKFGYYSQSGLTFKEDKRVIEIIKDIAEFIPLEKGRKLSAAQLLERFLFPKDQHYSYVAKLSGGERKRLYLLTILMSNPNFLILDEPTNDLDIKTIRVLEEFLLDFNGCLLIVSHDRAFMDRLCDHIFYFKGEGQIKDFPGNYSQLLTHLKKEEGQRSKEKNQKDSSTNTKSSAESDPAKKKLGYIERREYNKLEKEIEKLEASKIELSEKLSNQELSSDDLMTLSEQLGELVNEIDEKTERWLELAERA